MWKNGFEKDFIKSELLLTKVWMIYWKLFTVITYLITEKNTHLKKKLTLCNKYNVNVDNNI